MKNVFYSFVIRIVIAGFFVGLITNDGRADIVAPLLADTSAAKSVQLPAIEESLLAPFFKTLFTAIMSGSKNVKSLNYYTARELAIPLPGTNQEVVLHWKFKGSGDMFAPFPVMTLDTRTSLFQENQATLLEGLTFAVAQNEAYKRIKSSSIGKLLSDSQLNPIVLLGIKLILLLKTTINTSQSNHKVYAELMRLLFRFKLSIQSQALDKQLSLSLLIPDELKRLAEAMVPGFVEFIDELWMQFTSSTPLVHGTKYYSISCFVFYDKEFAEKMALKFAQNTSIGIETDWININAHEVVSFRDFAKRKNAQKLVGFLYTTHPENQNLPACIRQEIEKASTFPLIKLISTESGEQWFLHVSNKLGAIDTVKAMFLSFARTFHDYMVIKKENINSSGKSAHEEQERMDEIIQNFLETVEGKASFSKIVQEINSGSLFSQTKETVEQEIKQQKETLSVALQNLEKKYTRRSNDIERWKSLKDSMSLEKYENNVREAMAECATIEVEINQKKIELAQFEAEQDENDLKCLKALAITRQHQGESPSEQLITMINKLQSKVAPVATKQQQVAQRIQRQNKVIQVFNAEADDMEKQLKEKLATIKNNALQEMLFSLMRDGYVAYIAKLRQEAKRIEGIKLTEEIISVTPEEDFVAQISGAHNDFKELIADLNSNKIFKNVKQGFIDSLNNIFENSEHVQNNKVLYRPLIATFVPEFLPMLSPILTNVIL